MFSAHTFTSADFHRAQKNTSNSYEIGEIDYTYARITSVFNERKMYMCETYEYKVRQATELYMLCNVDFVSLHFYILVLTSLCGTAFVFVGFFLSAATMYIFSGTVISHV